MKKNVAKLFSTLLVLLLALSFIGCGDDQEDEKDDSGPDDDDDDDDDNNDNDDNDDDDTTEVNVISERVFSQGAQAPPNPETGAETPPEYNRMPVYRFRNDSGDDPPYPVSAIVVMVPGYAAGASDFFTFAHDLVETMEGDAEVWVVDRRSHLLEDQTGLDEAEAQKDPWIAHDYYFEGAQINDKTFEGFIESSAPVTEMMSEWGLNIHLEDVRKLLENVPEQSRPKNVFIGGHSRGARFSQMYAAYQFEDGHKGTDDLAGILLLDYTAAVNPMDENTYLDSIEAIRDGSQSRCGLVGTAGATTGNLVNIEIFAMAASEGFGDGDPEIGPDGFWEEWGLFEILFPFMTRFVEVQLSNEARFGLLFDDNSTPGANTFYGHMGRLTGGEVSVDAMGEYPSEPGATYFWANYNEVDPEEGMDIQNFLYLTYGGQSDFVDWYYPARLHLDDNAVDNLETAGTWAHSYLPFSNLQVDAAVFALEGFTAAGSGEYEIYRNALGPVRGSSQPRTVEGFDILPVHDWGHVEVLMTEPDRNPFLDAFVEFIGEWTDGKVQVPRFGQ